MMASTARYEKDVGETLRKIISDSLEEGVWRFHVQQFKAVAYKGWYDFRRADRIECDTERTFEQYLRDKVNGLVDLATKCPEVFDQEIGVLRSNYKAVAKKVVQALVDGGRFTTRYGQTYDGPDKIHRLLDLTWMSFFLTLQARFNELEKSIGKDYALIAIELRCRKLDDEMKRATKWKNTCPFTTDFAEAYYTYALPKLKELIEIDHPSWFH